MHQSINAPGAAIDVQAHLVPGKRTVLQFYADWCGTCAVWKKKVEVAAAHMPDTVMLYVDVVDFDTPAARQFGIDEVPYFMIYDESGRLASKGRVAYDSFWSEIHRYPGVPR
jgi:thiol:disulfide interchange protein